MQRRGGLGVAESHEVVLLEFVARRSEKPGPKGDRRRLCDPSHVRAWGDGRHPPPGREKSGRRRERRERPHDFPLQNFLALIRNFPVENCRVRIFCLGTRSRSTARRNLRGAIEERAKNCLLPQQLKTRPQLLKATLVTSRLLEPWRRTGSPDGSKGVIEGNIIIFQALIRGNGRMFGKI